MLVAALLHEFVVISPTVALIVVVPIAMQEMVMVSWLIVKGYDAAVIDVSSHTADGEQSLKTALV